MKTKVALAALCITSTSYALQLTDLGSMGEEGSSVTAISESGIIVGEVWTGNARRPFVYDAVNGMHAIKSQLAEPGGVNNSGEVVGMSGSRPAVFAPAVNATSFVGDLLLGPATTINNLGQVAGYFYQNRASADPHAFIYDRNHGVADLGCVANENGCYSVATAINEFGQVVGWSNQGAFIYSSGTMQSFGGAAAVARGINNHGDVVGEYWHNGSYRAFVYSQAVFREIEIDHVEYARATDINDRGQVIGFVQLGRSCDGYWQAHAFLYQNGTVTDLNTLLPDHEWLLQYVIAINNNGQIAGKGLHHGKDRAFLLTLD